MEPALIYAASDSLKYKVNWVKVSPETEWTYIGEGHEVNKTLVMKSIADYLPDSLLLVSINRQDSIQLNANGIGKAIENILGFKNFFIWDMQFKRVIEFNSIGVMRQGYI